ncbi:hypothetical protein ACQ9AQ_25270, partial [Escherichia coli]
AETAMYRMKQLLGDSLTLRDYDGQVPAASCAIKVSVAVEWESAFNVWVLNDTEESFWLSVGA